MKSPEYEITRQLIAHLRADAELEPMVLDDVFDNSAQVARLQAIAASHDGVIAVVPQDTVPLNNNGELRHGIFEARLSVLVFVHPIEQSAEGVFALAGRALAAILNWSPQGNGIPYTEPALERVDGFNAADYEGFEGMIGRAITVRVKVNYRTFYR